MIKRFGAETGLIVIDPQEGVDHLQHWGGDNGRRNNPQAEKQIGTLLDAWRSRNLPVF